LKNFQPQQNSDWKKQLIASQINNGIYNTRIVFDDFNVTLF